MKKNNTWLISIFAVFILLFSACNNSFNNQIEKNLDSADNKTATLYFSVNGASARNILPDTSLDNFSNFVLTGTLNGTTKDLGSWDTAKDMLDASVPITPGSWNFNLSAKRGEVNFTASTQLTIEENQSAVASFVLRASETDTGTLKLNLTYPAVPDLYKVTWYLSPVSNASSAEGFCKRDSSEGAEAQTLSETAFILQKELPAGKYMLSCEFGILYGTQEYNGQIHEMCSPVGNYYDYVVIQPGFESALNYEIDYFELTGITNAQSTDQGMVLTLDVPKGSQKILIMRIKNMSNAQVTSEEDAVALYSIITKKLASPTTSHQTFTITDCYGYSAGDELTYGVYFDEEMNSLSSVIKTFKAEHDALSTPGFTTYPEFATESDANGQTTKLKVTNTPVFNYAGDYKLNFISSEYELMLGTGIVFDNNTKEYTFTEQLAPGPNQFLYRLGFDKDGWSYNLAFDTTGLTGAQLPPVIQGPPFATPTANGIFIRVPVDWTEVSLLRATSPEGDWSTLKNFTYVYDYFEYLDKTDLTEGQTYYYKVVDEYGNTYGGEYFSATSIVTKGPLASMTTPPTLTVDGTVASITSGTYEMDEDINIVRTIFEFVNETDPSRKISVIKKDLKNPPMGYEWKYSEEHPEYDEYFDRYYTNTYTTQDETIDLYQYSIDGEKYIFSQAYVRFSNEYDSILYELPFTPQSGTYPANIQMPLRRIQLSAEAGDDGIVLTVSNIPEGTEVGTYKDIYIYAKYLNESTSIFGVENITQNTIVLTDSYVDPNKEYSYYAQVQSEYDNKSVVVTVRATGGSGELAITANVVDGGIEFNIPAPLTANRTCYVYRENLSTHDEISFNIEENTTSIKDIFVNPNTSYNYHTSFGNRYTTQNCSFWYYPLLKSATVLATEGSGEFEILELPAAEFNQETQTITFTAPPQFTVQNLPEGYNYSVNVAYISAENNWYSVDYSSTEAPSSTILNWISGTYTFDANSSYLWLYGPGYSSGKFISLNNQNNRMPATIVIE